LARKILLADDSVTAQNMGRKILADAGYEVITVNNGSAALKRIAEQKPDLIVLDVYMPGYSGLEVCQRLKETQETSRIPVLLTVGKLEPFKPEEAKRARADAFIVKPFEASELLSALTKLEDKIVPRSETSKPGRFARSIAAIEEGRYDRTMAADEDSGWKSRISFPSAKKKPSDREDADDSAIYNPVNKDLRTVVDPRPTPPQEIKSADARVDLGALATQGLPKDVTPEEIAALAAAAAQVQGSIATGKKAEPVPEPDVTPVAPAEEAKIVPDAKAETPSIYEQATVEIPRAAVAEAMRTEATQTDVTLTEVTRSDKAEGKEKIEAPSYESSEAKATSMAAGASLVQAPGPIAGQAAPAVLADVNSGNGAGYHSSAEDSAGSPAEEPVTMALAAGAAPSGGASRWTAVAVALAPEESAISLENEMQKAYAAFAAAETPRVAATKDAEPDQAGLLSTEKLETEVGASSASVAAGVQPLEAVASTETLTLTGQSETSESHIETAATVSFATTSSGPVPMQAMEPPIYSANPDSRSSEAEAEENLPTVGAHLPGAQQEEAAKLDGRQAVLKNGQLSARSDAAEPAREEPREAAVHQPESAAATIRDEFQAEGTSEAAIVPIGQEVAPGTTQAHGGLEGTAHKESKIAASTAAAWASWRRIRESGDSKGTNSESVKTENEVSTVPEDTAAMAVAAGAEHNPEESRKASDSEPEEIASIVDSVLADLRPKIVEEISRKLGKKK
jgi:twitching motility two-component system response regulator PilH